MVAWPGRLGPVSSLRIQLAFSFLRGFLSLPPRVDNELLALGDFVVAWPRRLGSAPFLRSRIAFSWFPSDYHSANILEYWFLWSRGRAVWGLLPLCELRLRVFCYLLVSGDFASLGAVCSWLDSMSDPGIFFILLPPRVCKLQCPCAVRSRGRVAAQIGTCVLSANSDCIFFCPARRGTNTVLALSNPAVVRLRRFLFLNH